MDAEGIKAIVEIFDGLGADARFIASAVIAYMFMRTILGFGLLAFIFVRVTKLITNGIYRLSLSKRLQHDLGYAGELVERERVHILKVWKKGLNIEKAEGDR